MRLKAVGFQLVSTLLHLRQDEDGDGTGPLVINWAYALRVRPLPLISCVSLCIKTRACFTGSVRLGEASSPASTPAMQSIESAKGA